jgi:mono/diheme cytochrome c family protein
MREPAWTRGAAAFFLLAAAVPAFAAGDVQRGKYIVTRVAMCGQCHTPHDDKFEPEQGRELQGAALPFGPLFSIPWAPAAPSLAGLPGGWTEAAVVKLLMTGEGRFGKRLAPPMPQFRMTKQDAEAVVAYLKSLGPARGKPPVTSQDGAPKAR